jgi:uncharacterized membrane protein YjgN (DUF898 family)
MNESISPAPAPAAPANRIAFGGNRSVFVRLLMRGAMLELVTVGFYRFWLATDIRRHLWSNTSVAGDAPEYTGTGKELLIGFLFALAILAPVYLLYFFIGIEAERLQAFASIPLVLFLYLFAQFAMYRARRYRLTRTIWRGVRFSMGGSGVSYAWRAALWSLLVVVTLGLALPWRQAALERFKLRYVAYGDLAGRFEGTGWQFFKRGWPLWLAALMLSLVPLMFLIILSPMVVSSNLSEDAKSSLLTVAALLVIAEFVAMPSVYAAYRAIEWRWWICGIRLGDVHFNSGVGFGAIIGLYWKVVGWVALLLTGLTLWGGVVVGAAFGLGGQTDASMLNIFVATQQYAVLAAFGLGYVLAALGLGVVMRVYLIRDVWQRVAASTTIYNLAAADNVAARGGLVGALGEGFADSLDVGGL